MKSTLVIYLLDLAELPWYAGTIHGFEGEGVLRITSATKIRRHAEWVLMIELGDHNVRLYSLTAHEAFSKSASRLSLKRLGSGRSSDEFAIQRQDKPREPFQIGDQSWKI